jgi:hypothetical protein
LRNGIDIGVLAGVLLFVGTGQIAKADNFTFNFNGVSSANSDAAIQTYMNSLLSGSGVSVTVGGAIATATYNGDGHVTGPGSGASSYTLDNMDGKFITNDAPGSNDILMTFTGLPADAYNVSFDLEIFPDGTCPSLSNCGAGDSNLPDLTFLVNGTTVKQWSAVVPATPGYFHSPASGSSSKELAPQLLQASGPLSFTITGGGPTTLEFDDWPATIGIDNLKLTGAPEPAGFLLLGTLVAGLFFLNRKKKQAL